MRNPEEQISCSIEQMDIVVAGSFGVDAVALFDEGTSESSISKMVRIMFKLIVIVIRLFTDA